MSHHLIRHTGDQRPALTRRRFLQLSSLALAGMATGCAVNPVTGRQQLMLVSEDQEIRVDKQNSPHQFSADYGVMQDDLLNAYIGRVGGKLAARSHRPQMPYSFQGVNAVYLNAYAFPGGSIAATRGILLELENEAQLAALLGHELGHVNARHTAAQMSTSMLGNVFLAGATTYASTQGQLLGDLTNKLGSLGAGLLLASYSRDNEREADALGMEYMVRSGYNPQGMIGLMTILQGMSKQQPSAIELMFATHPMSDERYRNAEERAQSVYRAAHSLPMGRERYMDATVRLRPMRGVIKAIQNGEEAMGKKQYDSAQTHFRKALAQAPQDYAGLVMMAKCQLALKKPAEASRYANLARQAYPREAQSYQLQGIASILQKKYDTAYQAFSTGERLLPGNPDSAFLRGLSLEGMQRRADAAAEYHRYLKNVTQGGQAEYAYQRLVEWGYLKPSP